MKTLMLIANPTSGKGHAKKILGSLIYIFRENGYLTNVYLTTAKGEAAEFAYEYSGDYDLLVCVGGDGTLSEVISGLMRLDKDRRPAVGYIPMGTANDIASSLGISKDPETAARDAVTGSPMIIDIGKAGDSMFSYIAAFGAFSEVSYTTPQNTKNILGHLAYIIEGISHLPSIRTHHTVVEYDEGTIDGDFIFGCVMNTLSVGGIVHFDPETVGLSDGYFEILLVKTPKNVLEYKDIIGSITSQKFDNENIVFMHSKKARFTFDEPVAWTRDGEDGGAHTDISLEDINCAVRIIVPDGGK